MLLDKLNIKSIICFAEGCVIKEFSAAIEGRALRGHVVKTLYVPGEETCKIHCFLNEVCQSINVSPNGASGRWKCELSDTDEKQNPQSLIEDEGFKYYASKVKYDIFPISFSS